MLGERNPTLSPIDQATISKWESGETSVRIEDLMLLAEVYGITADRLFFAPGDKRTPEQMRRVHAVLISRDAAAVDRWLELGEMLPESGDEPTS